MRFGAKSRHVKGETKRVNRMCRVVNLQGVDAMLLLTCLRHRSCGVDRRIGKERDSLRWAR